MLEVTGKYNTAKVFAAVLDPAAEGQIRALCDREFAAGETIRMMPDVHAGVGCTVGTTMTVGDRVVPNLVGVDIGCGMLTVKLREKRIRLPELDSFIGKNIPAGMTVRDTVHRRYGETRIPGLYCYDKIDTRRAGEGLGTLGGGNHFIEIDRDGDDLYLVIHSGSRNLGKSMAEYYQKLAYETLGGREQTDVPYEFAYLSGENTEKYLHDMKIMQDYAKTNRAVIADTILSGMKLREEGRFETVHNYIDTENRILRKGAVSARKGEKLLIPLNMRDGALLCTGLGNPEWNCSAPHGAGRKMTRADAMHSFTVSAYKKEMEGIFTTSVSKETLDECPMAYKAPDDIIRELSETVVIDKRLIPIYNFKAGENETRHTGRK